MRSADGGAGGPVMPTRSIVSVVGVSYQASNASRTNSFRLPAVVGSQFRGRCGPPTYTSNRPSASVTIWWPNRLASGMSPKGSCSDGQSVPGMVSGRGPCTVMFSHRAVPRAPVSR
jgi:hypothetical protein